MININNLLDVAYKELENHEITKLIEFHIGTVGYNKAELDFLYDIFYKKCPHLGRKLDSVLAYVRKNLDSCNIINFTCHPFCNMLLNLKNSKFAIEDILKYTDYEERIADLYQEIKPKLFKDEKLKPEEWDIIKTRLSQVYNDYELAEKVLLACIFKKVPYKNVNFAYDAAITFAKKQVNDVIPNNNISVILNPMINGGGSQCTGISNMPYKNYLVIKPNNIEYLCKYGSPYLFNTIFHEIRHFEQDIIAEENKSQFSNYQITLIKDMVLFELLDYDTFYMDNYHNTFMEADARYFGETRSLEYLKSKKIEFNDNYYECIPADKITTKRIYNGTETTLDELFNLKIQDHPEFLEKYPLLQHLYKLQEGKVKKKSIEELKQEIDIIKLDESMSDDDKQKLISSYSEYINYLTQDKEPGYDRRSVEGQLQVDITSRKNNGFIDIFIVLAIITFTCITGVILGVVIKNL